LRAKSIGGRALTYRSRAWLISQGLVLTGIGRAASGYTAWSAACAGYGRCGEAV